ncbi:MAG: DUF4347 domain-containing protein, partial [Magnetococcales bacterium]|nr:DUF4347 domain-containing protein [Magnetococcales bacterium]
MANYWLENVFGWFFPPDPKVRSHAQQRAAAFSQFLPLEQRLMFEGVGLLSQPDDPFGRDSHDAMHDSTDPLHHAPDPHHDIVDNLAQALGDPRPLPETNPQRTILFVDSRVPDLKHFLIEASPNLQVVVLDAQQDGVQHMATILDKLNTHFDAIQIVSHLNKDHVEIGGTTLSDKTIDTYQKELQSWGKSLNNGGSIQIYDAGSDTKIPTFIDKLAKSAGAEVVVSPYARVDLANTGITTGANRELVVIDTTVTDIPTLIGDLTRQAEVLLLDPNRDGFSQVAAFMAEHTGEFSALHVISHGSEGSIKLGSAVLDNSTLDSRQNVLKEWSQGLTAHADLLLYGCDVAQGTVGKEFVARLAEATRTHVAASDDRTGDAAKGGDWILEDHVGSVVTPVIINSTSGQNYHDTLATYTVTNLNDSGAGSLRQAISSANANAGDDDIVFTNGLSGNINLSSTITINDANNLTISGDTNNDSVADITIEGNGGNYKAFSVTLGSSTKTLTLQSININNFAQTALTGSAIWLGTNGGYLILNDSTISNCSASSAGAILANNGTHITLNRDILTGNSATGSGGSGGAIVAAGASVVLTINNCTISSNSATNGAGASGGGITSMFATTTINDSTISNNSAYNYAGVYISAGTTTIERCTIDSNSTTTGAGGGVGVVSGGTLLLYDSTISYNSSAAAGGGVNINSGSGTIDNCTFYGNSGSTVGGIRIASSTVTITNSTIANNTGTSQTGGISLNASATVNLANDIIANNTVGGVERDIDNTSSAGGVINANYCLIKDLTGASINTSTSNDSGNDPSLGALQNNGGTTWTMALGANSVAKDRWTAAQLAVYDTRQSAIDQRGTGYARVANGLVDIGAFEDQLPVATAGGSMAYVERAVAAAIDNTITVSDVDDTQSTGATVTISSGLTAGDVLDVATQNGISGSFNAATGVLTLTGTATLAQYQTALRSVTFSSTSHAPTATSASRTITWKVQDGSQSSTGVTSSISITAVNDAPSGTNTTITTLEDTPYTFTSADFGFSDSNDNPANSFLTVQITTLPAAGTLTNNGAAVNAGDWITQAEIIGGKLIFTPVANANGAGYTSFTFQVQDDGGILNGGIDLDPTPRTMTIDVTSVNDAPVLTAASPTLTTITEDQTTNAGQTVASFLGASVTDVDSGAVQGIAITGLNASNGTWQYDTGGGWTNMGVVTNTSALLLRSSDSIRFVPDGNNADSATVTYRAWDQTSSSTGNKVDAFTNTGATTAFSMATDTATITVTAVNDAPVLTAANPALTTITEDQTTNAGQTVASFLGASVTDVDSGAVQGIAITGLNASNGTWQYDTGGGWTNMGVVTNTSALLLRSSDSIRFVPDGQNADSATVTYRAWDQTSGSAGNKVDASTSTGATTAFSTATDTATITVTAVNDAPVLTGNATLASINAGMAAPGGASLSTLFNSAVVNLYSDVDLGSSFAGLAIVDNTANATTEGVWQYTSDGIHWADVGSVADGATALALSPGTHVRFLPVLSFNGVPTPLSVRGLDNTYMGGYSTTNAGESRVTVDTSTHGGSSAIANTPVTLGTFINPPNNTPSLTGDATLSAFNEDTAPTTATITSLFSSQFSDIDPGSSLGGVAIVANTANAVTQGAWQYSPDGGAHWYDVGNVGDNANALAVSAASLVRFSSVTNYNGTPPTLSIRGLDNTYAGGFSTATRVTLDTSIPDSRSPYSNSTNTIGVTINSVNDAPSGTNKTVTILEDGFHTFAASDFGFTDVSDTPANALNRVKITTLPIFGALTNNGVAVTIGSFITVADITGNKLVFTPAPNDAWSAYTSFTFKVEDDGGTANGGVNLDPVAKTITIDVTPVNDAPSFSGNATLASVGGVAMPSGATVNALFSGLFVDVDWNLSFGGLAIVGNTADSVNEGAWQYSSDGINWYNVGAVTDTSALMVGKNSSVRFVQVSGYTGTPTPLTVRAVDTTYAAGYSTTNAGQTRSLQDASVNGGSTPIAATTNTLGTTISATNNAPSMLGNPALAQISEDTFNPPGNTVANLMTSLFSDIDAGSSLKGVAIVANASNALTAGSWQYSSNGGTDWFDVGVVADNANALALSSTTLLRFVPVANFSGSTVNVQIRPLDDTYAGSFSTTNGTETRVTVDTSSPGGSSAIGPGLNTLTNFVASVNDAPVNTLQSVTATLNEDSSITFNAANANLVTVSDVIDTSQVGSNDFLVTVVSASHGIIGAVTGGGGTVNTNWTGSVTIFGTAAQVNAALNAMVYIPNSNYNGTDTLSITTNDAGNTGGGALADVDTIAITINAVNDAPVNTLQATTATLNEDGTQTFNAAHFNVISVSDANDSSQVGGVDDLATVVNVTHGTLTVITGGGALITNNTSASVTIAGTSTQVNAALNGMVYTPTANYNGADTLTVTTNDLGNTGSGGVLTDIDTIAITVNPVNDAPVLSLQSATASLNEDATQIFDAAHVNLITVNDAADTAQASGVDSLSTTVSVTHGTLTAIISGATLTNNTSASVTIAGTTAQVNAALAGLIYTPNADYNGSDTLTIASSDLGNTGIGGVLTTSNTIAITVNPVNDAPVNTLQAATASLNEDATLVFDAAHTNLITVNDTTDTSQVGGVDSLSTLVSVTHGTLTATLSGATLTNNGTGSITIAGTAAQVNAALAGLIYTPNAEYNGSDTLTVTTNDLGNTGGGALADVDTIAITVNPVNDAPVLSLQSATASLNEDDTLVFDAAHVNLITVNDAVDTAQASGVDSLSATVSVTHGTLTAIMSGASLTNNGSGSITIAGTTTQVNAALAGLIYTPNADYNGSDTLTIASSDLGNTGIGGVLTATNTIAITVNAVNDAPVNTLQAATASLNEDATLVFDAAHANLITVNDAVDVAQLGGVDSLSTSVSVTHGTLTATLSGATLTSNSSASVTIAGTAAQVNAALAGLIYTPNADFTGSDTLTIASSDLGNTGVGGALTTTNTIMITVNAVNDTPVNTLQSSTASLNEDGTLVFDALHANLITVNDNTDTLQVNGVDSLATTVSVTHGKLTATLSGATLTNNGSGSVTIAGTAAQVNAALAGLIYTPNADYNGSDIVTIATNDSGFTGGGPLSATNTIAITVNPVNDAPVHTLPSSASLNEDGTLVFDAVHANLITVNDSADTAQASGVDNLSTTVSVIHGKLTATISGATLSNNGSGSITIAGTAAQVNAALAGLIYTP